MDCRQVDRLLEANLDGRLSGFERAALRQHLRGCGACRAKVEAMTAFAARVERTLAAADGPDWSRLAPPTGAVPEMIPQLEAPTRSRPTRVATPERPVRRRRKSWPAWVVVLVGAALMAAAVPLWTRPPAPPARALWPEEAVAVEATRRAAGGAVDLRTDDIDAALAWLGARGLPGVPGLDLPAGVALEGAFLTYYGEQRTGGLALVTASGPAALHLRPPSGVEESARAVRGQGLEARVGRIGTWQALVIAPSDTAALSTLGRWLAGAEPVAADPF